MITDNHVQQILGNELVRGIVERLGINDANPEDQIDLIEKIGGAVLNGILLEIVTALDESTRNEFRSYLERGDPRGARALLEKNIKNLDAFIQRAAQTKLAEIEKEAAETSDRPPQA